MGIRKSSPTSNEDLRNELLDIYQNAERIKEVDWSKVRDLAFHENREALAFSISKITGAHYLECPNFLEHVHPIKRVANHSMLNSTKSILFGKKSKIYEI